MTDIRRTVLWVIFASSLLFLWDAWNVQNGRPPLFGLAPQKPAATQPAAGASANGVLPTPAAATSAATGASAPAAATAALAPVASQTVVVGTDTLRATLDTRGGDLVKVELVHERASKETKEPVVLLDRSAQRFYVAQSGLVPAGGSTALPNHQTVFTLRPGERTLAAGAKDLPVVFESPEVGGVKLVKTYVFHRGSYAVDVKHEVVNAGSVPANAQLYLRLVRDGTKPPDESSFYSTFTGPAVYTESSKFHKIEFSDVDKGKVDIEKTADNGWVAMVQHYFASAWLVNAQQPREFSVQNIGPNPLRANDHLYAATMVLPLGEIAPGTTKAQDAQLFVGPQEENTLAALAPGLELVKDYGWLRVLAKPLFWLLFQLHQLIGNWGWAIVALVVVLKIAFYWLNASAYRSMAKMKAVNPKIMEIRERYKDKPQQLQQEMMRIYREEKINPLGGCLPIFIQMPFFIALYWVLLSSAEMRHAPWIGWITDLSAKDPFFILPLLMTASSLVQTWLNPTPPDPVQARMMWIMPLAFSVMFFFFPSGLVLYWLTNNILSIAQQWLINKRLGVLNT